MTRSIAKSPRVAEQCDLNIYSLCETDFVSLHSEKRCIEKIKYLVVKFWWHCPRTATAGSDGVQFGRPIFDDFFQHLWPYIGNNTANVVFQMVKRLWLIRIDQ
ncbi:hypothetical protein TNCV_2705471 [Trichonephila clavipes]|nr:hypothetical protein TNCV_2705471 [Trichonephila clavipes]